MQVRWLLVIAGAITISADIRKFIGLEEETGSVRDLAFCTSLVAQRLFTPGHRIVVLTDESMDGCDEIGRALTRDETIFISSEPIRSRNVRLPSYIMIDDTFLYGRRLLLGVKGPVLRTFEYLFVTKANETEMSVFAGELWRVGFRDIAFLSFNGTRNTIVFRASAVVGGTTALRSVGLCTAEGNNVDRLERFAADIYRFSREKGPRLKYGRVTDVTVNFWRREDALRRREHTWYKTIGGMLITEFSNYANITFEYGSRDLSWAQASQELINGNLDIVNGLMPHDLKVMDGLEIVTWYMYRDMVFATQLHSQVSENDIFKMLKPFHYLVWLCIVFLLLAYVSLLFALTRLARMGLIRERVRFLGIFKIMMGQGAELPRKFGLKLVLLLWILFSLYLSITYQSTFTSSLAKIETEDMLKDLKALRDSNQPLGGPAILRRYLNAYDDPVTTDLYHRYTVMTPREALNKIFINRTVVAIQEFTVNRLNWINRRNRSLRIYSIPGSTVQFPVFLFSRKAHPFRDSLRKFVMRYRDTGLINQAASTFMIDEDKYIVLKPSEDEILRFEHLRPLFDVFLILQAFSCLLLFVELAQAYASRREGGT